MRCRSDRRMAYCARRLGLPPHRKVTQPFKSYRLRKV
jgi:hypothetical protein